MQVLRVVIRNASFTGSYQYQNKHALRERHSPAVCFSQKRHLTNSGLELNILINIDTNFGCYPFGQGFLASGSLREEGASFNLVEITT